MINPSFWKGKRVFVTGHTGFKGGWMCLWLRQLGVEVIGYSLKPATVPSLFEVASVGEGMQSIIGDIRDHAKLSKTILGSKPDLVIHMAAQPLVRYSYAQPAETYEVNVMGTIYLLEAVRATPSVKAVVNVTSDKCYENQEKGLPFKEDDKLGGLDIYSASKACSEILTKAYYKSFFEKKINISTARAGNIIGGGDFGDDRIIPDLVDAIVNNKYLEVRSPKSIRPWQHVLEPLSGYLSLGKMLMNRELKSNIIPNWNFGPYKRNCKKVCDRSDVIWVYIGRGS